MGAETKRIAVLGAGQIGAVIAGMLAEQGHRGHARRRLRAGQSRAVCRGALDRRWSMPPISTRCGPSWPTADIVVSACPYFLNKGIARVAVETGTHYFDLTEDVATTAYIKEIGAGAPMSPWCRNAGWRPASSASSAPTWRRASRR